MIPSSMSVDFNGWDLVSMNFLLRCPGPLAQFLAHKMSHEALKIEADFITIAVFFELNQVSISTLTFVGPMAKIPKRNRQSIYYVPLAYQKKPYYDIQNPSLLPFTPFKTHTSQGFPHQQKSTPQQPHRAPPQKNPHLTMSNLADLVLAAEEPDLEDPMLQKELARLQARRAATPPVTASFSRPTSARPASARVASQVEKPVAQRLGWEEELSYSQKQEAISS